MLTVRLNRSVQTERINRSVSPGWFEIVRQTTLPLRSDGHEVSRPLFMEATLSKTRLGFIETAGGLCQKVGMPRSTGQIFGLLYLSSTPLPLEEIASLLSISKASASTGSRQLLGWQAIRQVWVPGDRRDFFEARGELRDVLRAGYDNLMRPKLDKSIRKLEGFVDTLEVERTEGTISKEEYQFCRARLQQLEKIQDRVRQLLPLAERLL